MSGLTQPMNYTIKQPKSQSSYKNNPSQQKGVILIPHKKAPGKGGHHLTPFYPLTHPGNLSEAGAIDSKCMDAAPDKSLLDSHYSEIT
jgi:hypothetical protein